MVTVNVNRRTRLVRLAAARHGLQSRAAHDLSQRLDRFFRRQARHVRQRFLEIPVKSELKAMRDTNRLVPEGDADELIRLILTSGVAVAVESSEATAALIGVTAPAEDRLRMLLLQAGDRIRNINDATRAAVQRALEQGLTDRLTDRQLGRRLREVVEETYSGRSQAIARTEMALADQAAAHEVYREAGLATVLILDGSDCGWTRHNDPDKANGSRRSLAEAESHPVSHPNCVRVSVPDV